VALTITQSVLDEANALRESGDIAGAWSVLSEAGDLYATNARDIIYEINNPVTVFAKNSASSLGQSCPWSTSKCVF
jgi:hypothetical protein